MPLTLLIARALALCALLASGAACAAADAKPPYGIWRGTLGGQDVMVKLVPDNCDPSYYYLRHLWGIRLTPAQGAAGEWREGTEPDAGPRWRLRLTGPGALTGEWVGVGGRRRLPLQLTKVADAPPQPDTCWGPEAEAMNEAFNAPRVAAKQPQARPANFQGRAYQVLSVPGTELRSVQLPATPRPVPRLNQFLRAWLDGEVAALYDCQLGASRIGDIGAPRPDYLRTHEPVFWNEHLLVLRENFSYYCGGAYPDAGVGDYLVWNLDTDQAEPMDRWLRAARVDGEGEATIWTPQLKALIVRRDPQGRAPDDECRDGAEIASGYLLYPRRSGMVFMPSLPHVARACAEDIEVPWRELKPHLSPLGLQRLRDKLGP